MITSLGRVALSLTIFSASGAQASTATGSFNSAMAKTAAMTAAAPLISLFMASIPWAGFRASPPESKVIPLPTKANRFFAFAGV